MLRGQYQQDLPSTIFSIDHFIDQGAGLSRSRESGKNLERHTVNGAKEKKRPNPTLNVKKLSNSTCFKQSLA